MLVMIHAFEKQCLRLKLFSRNTTLGVSSTLSQKPTVSLNFSFLIPFQLGRTCKAVHIKLYSKTQRENTDATLGLIYNLRDACARTFLQCDEMKKKIESLEHVDIHHAPGPINNDDRKDVP
jgi:hypothetical protein